MRTTLDLPDEVLRRAKITAIERGVTLRQLVTEALQREISAPAQPRQRLERPPIKLDDDSPLRHLSLEEVKRLDAEDIQRADEGNARALLIRARASRLESCASRGNAYEPRIRLSR